MTNHKHLKALNDSANNKYSYDEPSADLLESFEAPITPVSNQPLRVNIEIPEFTSLCPKTGQPDFAKIIIDYTPNKYCVESKSLKLYLMGYRNYGAFHEACVQTILDDIVTCISPKQMNVTGQFASRGGISIWPTSVYVAL